VRFASMAKPRHGIVRRANGNGEGDKQLWRPGPGPSKGDLGDDKIGFSAFAVLG
jgi:hypothetical protein